MKKLSFLFLICGLAVFINSCKKESDSMMINPVSPAAQAAVIPVEPFASYKLILTGRWKTPEFTVPAGNHFTRFEGMIHNSDAYIFHLGIPASLGAENVAEVGNSTVLLSEMDNYISAGKALGKFSLTLPNIIATDSVVINLTLQQSLISFESMIAPSPDWFAGLDSYNLIQNGKWVNDITINIAGYDAGTEDGDVFGYNNPATSPQQNVSYLTPVNASVIANGNSTLAPFATLRIIKQ